MDGTEKMKIITSKKTQASLWTNTTGIANQIESVLNKVYSTGAGGSGIALVVRDSDGQLYEIDIKPAKLGTHKDQIQHELMLSERDEDKELLRELYGAEASGSKSYEDWPTDLSQGDNDEKNI